jgi:hypothetical protein
LYYPKGFRFLLKLLVVQDIQSVLYVKNIRERKPKRLKNSSLKPLRKDILLPKTTLERCSYGIGVRLDYDKALNWFRKAGKMFRDGCGV